MKCLVCGKELPETAQFCNSCGTKVPKNESINIPENKVEPSVDMNDNNNLDITSSINQAFGGVRLDNDSHLFASEEKNTQSNGEIDRLNIESDSNVNLNNNIEPNSNAGLNNNVEPNSNVNLNNNIEPNSNVGLNNNIEPNSSVNLNNNIEPNSNVGLNNNIEPNSNSGFNNIGLNSDSSLNNNKFIDNNDLGFNNYVQPSNVNQTVAQPQMNNSNINSNNIKPKKKKKKILPIIIIFMLLIAVAAVLAWFFLFRKPDTKKVFVETFEKATNKLLLGNNYKKYDSIKVDYSLKTNISTNMTQLNDLFNITNNIGISGNTAIDFKNKLISGNIMLDYENKNAVNVDIYGKENKIYLYYHNLFDKYLFADEDISFLFQESDIDYDNLSDSLNKAFKSALKDKYLSSKKETISVNGKSKKVNSNILTMNENDALTFINDYKKSLANDDKFIELISKLTKTDSSEIKSGLKASIDNLESDSSSSTKFIFTIYTSGLKNNFEGLKLEVNDGDQSGVLTIIQDSKNNYKVSLQIGLVSYSFNIKISQNKNIYTISYNDGSNKIELNIGYKETYNAKINVPDISNSININNLTEADYKMIRDNLLKNNTFVKLITDLEKIDLSTFENNKSKENIDNPYSLQSQYNY